jgi:hypothetical protein
MANDNRLMLFTETKVRYSDMFLSSGGTRTGNHLYLPETLSKAGATLRQKATEKEPAHRLSREGTRKRAEWVQGRAV